MCSVTNITVQLYFIGYAREYYEMFREYAFGIYNKKLHLTIFLTSQKKKNKQIINKTYQHY